MSNRMLVGSLALLFVIVLAGPLPVFAQEDLVVKGEHIMQITRAGPDSDVGVIENLFLENQGDEPFDGELLLDLHPAVQDLRHYFHNGTGVPYPGEPGVPSDEPLATETVGDHERHSLVLADRELSVAPGETVILVLQYRVPAAQDSFTRGFTLGTERFTLHMADVAGLYPESQQTPLEPVREPRTGAWTWRLAPGSDGGFAAGDAFAFTWQPKQEPLEPLRVDIQVTGQDPLELTAMATGGIGPDYVYDWDLTGDGQCDDAEGPSVEIAMDEPDERWITVCVTDAASPPGEARQSFQARMVFIEGAWDGPSPWLLLVIGLLGGGFLIFALTQGGFVPTGGRRSAATGPAFGAESREMLEMRQRVMVAALKELEIAKKKGEVPEAQYTSLKSELKKDTVSVMRELERRKTEKETV